LLLFYIQLIVIILHPIIHLFTCYTAWLVIISARQTVVMCLLTL